MALVFVAIGLVTACGDDSPATPPTGTPGGGSPATVAATPSCTFIPGEGLVCIGTPQPTNCLPSTDHIPFFDQLVLPKTLPAGLSFEEACLTACPEGVPCNQPAEIKYANEDGSAKFQISTAIGERAAPGRRSHMDHRAGVSGGLRARGARASTRSTLQLRGRAHTVIAILGPDNRITEAELDAVALDIASQ